MKKVYAAEYCSCIYESGFKVLSLHETKAGAYKAMREDLIATHARDSSRRGQYRRNYFAACTNERWRVKTYDVEE